VGKEVRVGDLEDKVRTVTADGLPLAYSEFGKGEALICLHGGGPGATGISNFRRNIGLLSESFRVIVVDLPGYGASPWRPVSEGDGRFESLARVILSFMDVLGIAHTSFIGNSLGGAIAISVAMQSPERVRRMILLGPGGGYSLSPAPTEGLLRMLAFYDGEGPTREKLEKVLDHLVFDRSAITPELVEERFQSCTRPEVLANPPLKGASNLRRDELWRGPLDQVHQPTLIVWGREDRVLSWDSALVLTKALPNAELHLFSKTGHWAQWERADEFNLLVKNFLDRA
jgi:pimeloyl-ACP methyl ester carboxylesterase